MKNIHIKQNMVKITVGVTCYNAENTIERAMQSALSQDWPNLEVLVVDDHSTDNSWELIERFCKSDSRVKSVRHTVNSGPAVARNTVLASAAGNIVAFFDDDDESLPDRVRVQYETLRDYEETTGVSLIACYASGLRRYPNGYELKILAIGSQPDIPKGEMVADYLLYHGRKKGVFYGAGTPTCALMARKSTFRTVGGFDNNLRRVEDVDFAIRLALIGGHFVGTSKNLFIQYSSIGEDKSPEKNLEAEQYLAEKYRSYLESIGFYYYAWHWPKLRYWHFKHRYLIFLWELVNLFIRYPVVVTTHLLSTGPVRILHEFRMSAKNKNGS